MTGSVIETKLNLARCQTAVKYSLTPINTHWLCEFSVVCSIVRVEVVTAGTDTTNIILKHEVNLN